MAEIFRKEHAQVDYVNIPQATNCTAEFGNLAVINSNGYAIGSLQSDGASLVVGNISGGRCVGIYENTTVNNPGADAAIEAEILPFGFTCPYVILPAVSTATPDHTWNGAVVVIANSQLNVVNLANLSGSYNVIVGRVVRVLEYGVAGGRLLIDTSLAAASAPSGATGITALTDSTGGVNTGTTLAAVTTFTPSVAWNGSSVYPSAADATAIAAAITSLKNSMAVMAKQVNLIIAALASGGLQ